jgi:hypothetical protein
MSTVYVINVGCNTSHSSIALSPVFPDGRFHYVSFPTKDRKGTQTYPAAALLQRLWAVTTCAERAAIERAEQHLRHGDRASKIY